MPDARDQNQYVVQGRPLKTLVTGAEFRQWFVKLRHANSGWRSAAADRRVVKHSGEHKKIECLRTASKGPGCALQASACVGTIQEGRLPIVAAKFETADKPPPSSCGAHWYAPALRRPPPCAACGPTSQLASGVAIALIYS